MLARFVVLIAATLIAYTTPMQSNIVLAAENDVFFDEGDGDFDAIPVPTEPAAKSEETEKPKAKGKGKAGKSRDVASVKEDKSKKRTLMPDEMAAGSQAAADPLASESPAPEGLSHADIDFSAPVTPEPETTSSEPPPALTESSESEAPTFSEPMPVEESEKPAKKSGKKANAKKTAQKSNSKSGKKSGGQFVQTKDACDMKRSPASDSDSVGKTGANRRIWVENVDGEWVKAFNKAGEPGFISRTCVD